MIGLALYYGGQARLVTVTDQFTATEATELGRLAQRVSQSEPEPVYALALTPERVLMNMAFCAGRRQ